MATIKAVRPLVAFLDLIAWSEGTQTHPLTKDNGYDVIASGVDGLHVFTDYSCHPFTTGRKPIVVREEQQPQYGPEKDKNGNAVLLIHGMIPEIISTASDRYQIILPTWEHLREAARVGTFSPMNQDLAAVKLIEEAHATESIVNGRLPMAFQLVSNTLASFPGNLYGQGGHSADELLSYYDGLMHTAVS